MIQNFLEKVKNTPITIGQWMIGFLGIFFVRFILEVLSSPTRSGMISSDIHTIVHYGLFWLTLTLGFIIICGQTTKDYIFSSKLALFGLPVIWTAPVFDIVISHGGGFTQSYLFDTGRKLVFDFATFFGTHFTSGITYGIRLEMILALAGIAYVVWTITKHLDKTVLAVVCAYVFGFLLLAMPGIVYTLSHINNAASTQAEAVNYFAGIISHSNLSHNTVPEGEVSMSAIHFAELGFSKLMSQVWLLVSSILAGYIFWKINRKKFKVVWQNSRPERIMSYLSLLLCGAGFAYIQKLGTPLALVDVLGILCLLLAWISLWMHAVHINDVVDVDIDAISNPDRPLIKKELNESDMRETGYVWLAIALLGSWAAGFYPFFMALVYMLAYHIYSAPPLRLRRFPFVSSFLIGIAGLATILSGFFFMSAIKQLHIFPIFLAAGIVIMITLAINVKDMKDIEGDKANDILTLPILFGKNGPKAVGLCFALSFLLVPIFLSFFTLYLVAIPAAIIGYRLVMRKPYKEDPIFVLRFAFLVGVGALYLAIYWIGYTYHLI